MRLELRSILRGRVVAVTLGLAAVLVAGSATAQTCPGDFDGSGGVSIDEVMLAVRNALDGCPKDSPCDGDLDSDGEVEVDELVSILGNTLRGCDGGEVTEARVIERYAALLYANYGDTITGAMALREAIDAFLADPQQATLDAAKAAWLAARPAYQESEIGRFYNGPIDNEESGPEGRINGWPLDESFIDYVEGNPEAGIINAVDEYPTITKDLIVEVNELGSESNISAGWHAIEFLLWGQDLSEDGPGNRPFTDYVVGTGGTAANQDRRGQYLRSVAELLVEDLTSVRQAWAPGAQNYRAEFVALDPKVALARILTGIGTLSGFELSNERMAVALDTQDQEDEHSCFSDNTHIDHLHDEIGIQNVYFGRYGGSDGPGIDALVRAVDPGLDAEMQAGLNTALDAIEGIPTPFDQSIQGSDSSPARQAIIGAVGALRDQTELIEEVAAALDVDITTTQ